MPIENTVEACRAERPLWIHAYKSAQLALTVLEQARARLVKAGGPTSDLHLNTLLLDAARRSLWHAEKVVHQIPTSDGSHGELSDDLIPPAETRAAAGD